MHEVFLCSVTCKLGECDSEEENEIYPSTMLQEKGNLTQITFIKQSTQKETIEALFSFKPCVFRYLSTAFVQSVSTATSFKHTGLKTSVLGKPEELSCKLSIITS